VIPGDQRTNEVENLVAAIRYASISYIHYEYSDAPDYPGRQCLKPSSSPATISIVVNSEQKGYQQKQCGRTKRP